MRRFFIETDSITGDLVVLTGTEAHHMATVLRLSAGVEVEFIDGSGRIYDATLTAITRKQVTAQIKRTSRVETGSSMPVTLVQGLLKGKRMEVVIQKATELGVAQLLPLCSRFCEQRDTTLQRRQRWQRIMIEACKQSKRVSPMQIQPISFLSEIDFTPYAYKFVAYEQEDSATLPLDLATRRPGPICLCIGPEGGWHHEEISMLVAAGFQPFSLGKNILRGETAAIAAVAIVQHLLAADPLRS